MAKIEASGKSKQISQSSPSFAAGGHNNHMCSKYGSATAGAFNMTTQGDSGKWAKGGSGHMTGRPGRAQKPA